MKRQEAGASSPATRLSKALYTKALYGFVLGILVWQLTGDLGLWILLGSSIADITGKLPGYLLGGALGAVCNVSRARIILRTLAAGVVILFVAVIATPYPMSAARGLVRSDPLARADAVYVLGSGVQSNGKLVDNYQRRMLQAYEVLAQGYAPRLLIPRLSAPAPEYIGEVRRQMHLFHLKQPVEEIPTVHNTFEEAAAIHKLVQSRHWKRVIVVSSPTHMRRVAAVFRKAGVPVLCSPCTEGDFDLNSPGYPPDRLKAFQTWLRESLGYQVYRLRGRI